MKINFKRRTAIKILSFTTAFVLVLSGVILSKCYEVNTLKRNAVHENQANIQSLAESMESISVTLKKSLYVNTPSGINSLADKLIMLSGNAGAALSHLSAGDNTTMGIAKFIAQVSDYCSYISKKAIMGEAITDEERSNLKRLADTAEQINAKIDEIYSLYNSYDIWTQTLSNELDKIQTTGGLSDTMYDIEESLSDTPALVYDGPFSDHINQKEAIFLEDKAIVDEGTALKKAAEILSLSTDQLTKKDDEDGTMPSYCFEGENCRIAITKSGGYVSYFRIDTQNSYGNISYEQAVKIATDYANSLGLGDFEATYYFYDEGICTVNLAYKQNNVICYTDLIKVGVELASGKVVLFEARGYIMNHKAREAATPTLSPENAAKIVSPHLNQISHRLCLIPNSALNETLCYEFNCEGENKENILVYINANNATEENVLILLKADGGTLTQ